MTLDILRQKQIPQVLPASLEAEIDRLHRTPNQTACLQAAYDLITYKYRGYLLKTYTHLFSLFQSDIDKLWAKSGFLHCTSLNYMLRVCLIKSGHFQSSDITFHWTLVNYLSPHQYLKVKINNDRQIEVDPWGKAYGVAYGTHAHGFLL